MIKILLLITLALNLFAKDNIKLLIPLYSHPSKWLEYTKNFDKLKKKKIKTYAIINPFNGPSTKVDKQYIEGIKLLKKYDIEVLGYVYTQYSKRNPYKVKEDIYKWSDFYSEYGVRGIFFDETTIDEKHVEHYKELLNYTKSLDFDFNVLNAGYTTNKKYLDLKLANVIVTYENSHKAWKETFPKKTNKANEFTKLSILLHEMKDTSFEESIKKIGSQGFEYIYLTEDTLPNPWDDLSTYLINSL